MTTYIVTRKSDGAEVYRYASAQPEPWVGFEFATHDHTPEPDPVEPVTPAPVLQWERLDFLRRFTMSERIPIRNARAADPVLHDFFSLLEQADTIHSNDPDTLAGMGYLVQQGYLTVARRDEILGGA
jgi:hypothetical protein